MQAELDALLQSLRASQTDPRRAERLVKAAAHATKPQRDHAISQLAPVILHQQLSTAATAATICGSLIELGGDPKPIAEPVLTHILPSLERLASKPRSETAPQPQSMNSVAPGVVRSTWNFLSSLYRLNRAMRTTPSDAARVPHDPDEATLHHFAKAATAMFAASPALRAAHPEVRELSQRLCDSNGICYWLHLAFNVLDNAPILVLHPAERTGITARISGIDINFTLNMLLMRDFPGAAKPRLSHRAASVLNADGPQQANDVVTGCWDLYNYTALDAAGGLPTTGQYATDHWVWNEGKPADISVFEGRRVILLGPPSYPRTWPAQRTFAAMIPKLEIESTLTPTEVDAWIKRLL